MPHSTLNSRQLCLRLLQQVRPYWKAFVIGLIFMALLAATEAGIPALLKPVLDGTFVEKKAGYLAWAPLALVGLFLVRGLASLIQQIAFAHISTHVVNNLRNAMFQRLLRMPTHYYATHATGNIISKITYDVLQVMQASTEVLTVIVKDTLAVIGLIAYIFWLDWQLACLIFILIPIVVLIATLVGKRLRRISRQLQTAQGDTTHILEEALRGHKAVKIFGGQAYEKNRFADLSNWVRQSWAKFLITSSLSVPFIELIGAIMMAAVMYLGTMQAAEQQLSVGGFVAFFTALGLLFSPIKRIAKVNEPLQRGLAAAETIFALLDEPLEIDQGQKPWPQPIGRISMQAVCFRYPEADQEALSAIQLEIAAGTTIALVGSSGSGKSTLVNLIPRLYNATAGKILLDGIDIQDLSLSELRQQIALVSQETVLFNASIAENIAYGMQPTPTETAIAAAAKAAHADAFIRQLPEGYQTVVGENGIRLSGGQRQRIAIARAILKDARILILDEATSALDNASERTVKQALETLRKGRTTLIIAHRLSTVEHADHILVMEQGRIVETGTHNTLLAKHESRYAQLYQSNQQGK